MFKKMVVLKDIVIKIGCKKVYELLEMVEGNDVFVVEVKIKKNGIEFKKEEIMLKDN